MSTLSIGANGLLSASYTQTLSQLRTNLDTLSQQLATGQKANDYAGLGFDRATALSVQDQLNSISGYGQSASTVQLRLNVMQNSIDGLNQVVSATTTSLDPTNFQLVGNQTATQTAASAQLDNAVEMLNGNVSGHYLFGGREVSQAPVVSSDVMMNGSGSQAGFNQVVAERRAADFGTGTGRLVISQPDPNSVTVASDGNTPFGFKIGAGAASTSIAGATVTVDPTAPSSATVALTQQPVAGDTVRLTLTMPDGTTTDLSLTAVAAGTTPAAGQFAIGSSLADTTSNLTTALNQSITTAASTTLVPASAMAAANDFFSSNPPQRVAIPAGGTAADATAMRDGSADTVEWYQGEDDGSSPRATQSARVDAGITVGYGARADEAGTTSIISALAVMSAVQFGDTAASGDTSDDGAQRYTQLVDRVKGTLTGGSDLGPLGQISTDLAAVQQTVTDSQSRQTTSQNMLQGMLSSAEGVDTNDVAVSLLTAQTNLQASYQATAMLSKLSLVNYLDT